MFRKTNLVNKSHPADKLIELSKLLFKLVVASARTFISSDDVEANSISDLAVKSSEDQTYSRWFQAALPDFQWQQ